MGSALPVDGFNPLDRKVQACPYPYYQTMRAQCPVYPSPQTGMYYVTKYDDIRFIKKRPDLFTSDMTHSSRQTTSVTCTAGACQRTVSRWSSSRQKLLPSSV